MMHKFKEHIEDNEFPTVLINSLIQVNTTYLKYWLETCPRNKLTTLDMQREGDCFSELMTDENVHLLARAVQFFTPGSYKEQSIELLNGVSATLQKRLITLIQFRQNYPAFQGELILMPCKNTELRVVWKAGRYVTELEVDFIRRRFRIDYNHLELKTKVSLEL